ncbi:alpha/beta hydrolase [Novosphingobium sp.]|uniref:alpha/beta hydrolase n=1 Tax=Novosphingobium sp. TaxID=1874826 RepID=UPI0038B96839
MILRILRFLGNAVLVLLPLAALGCIFPRIPVFGELGPVVTSPFGPWLVLLSLAGAVLVFRRWLANRRKRTLALAVLAVFAGLGTVSFLGRQIVVARDNGIHIDLGEALLTGSQADETLMPTTVVYARHDGVALPLDIYQPAKRQDLGPAPMFVYIHGGGWGAETLKQRQADYRWFAERGYLVISLEYTLSSETRVTWNVAEPELACALAWVGANAARLGGDPGLLALWGESAGGNLVLNLSYRANAGKLDSACPGALPHVAATIALYPVIDPARMYHNPDLLIGVFGRTMTRNYTGGTPEQFPDRYAAIGSATHINAKAPPTLLIVPEADHLVAPEAAYDFATRARTAGIDTRLIRMPFAEHAFDLRSGSIGNQLVRQAMLQFLQAHGLGAQPIGEPK